MGEASPGRLARVTQGFRESLVHHDSHCGDRVAGIALNPEDHAKLGLAELWGLPVLAWDHVHQGRVQLLCDAFCVVIPQIETAEELIERWTYQLER